MQSPRAARRDRRASAGFRWALEPPRCPASTGLSRWSWRFA